MNPNFGFPFFRSYFFLSMFLLSQTAFSQSKPAYVLYSAKGKKASYDKMLRQLSKADIVLFGESHNNPICHWLQLELVRDLHAQGKLEIGAEMFERDNEAALAQYMADEISDSDLSDEVRLWRNYKTDYKPIVEFAKEVGIPFVSTNIPRRYASMVYQEGFEVLDTFTEEEKSWIVPLPIAYDPELPGYKNMLTMIPGHGGENFPKAQAIKDATMAHFILENHQAGNLFFHLNGSYHSDNHEGIVWYLQQKQPDLKIVTITTVSQEDPTNLEEEYEGRADFILCIPERMTKTY